MPFGRWSETNAWAPRRRGSKPACSLGEFNPCPVALSYLARIKGISVLPSHCLSNTESHRGTGILCISSGQLICVDCNISYATIWLKNATIDVMFLWLRIPSAPLKTRSERRTSWITCGGLTRDYTRRRQFWLYFVDPILIIGRSVSMKPWARWPPLRICKVVVPTVVPLIFMNPFKR